MYMYIRSMRWPDGWIVLISEAPLNYNWFLPFMFPSFLLSYLFVCYGVFSFLLCLYISFSLFLSFFLSFNTTLMYLLPCVSTICFIQKVSVCIYVFLSVIYNLKTFDFYFAIHLLIRIVQQVLCRIWLKVFASINILFLKQP